MNSEPVYRSTACRRNLGLGCRQGGETELGAQPPAYLLDRLVHFGHAAGTEDEVVLACR